VQYITYIFLKPNYITLHKNVVMKAEFLERSEDVMIKLHGCECQGHILKM